MLITHRKVKKIAQQAERRIKKLTGNDTIVMLVLKQPKAKMTFDQIQMIVCAVRDQNPRDVFKKTRKREYVTTRQLISYYANTCGGMTLSAIAERLGFRDHTTVMHAIARVKALMESEDPMVCRDAKMITEEIRKISALADSGAQ